MAAATAAQPPESPGNGHEFIGIAAGDYRADISAFGGGPRALDFAGRPLLVSYPRGEYPALSAGTLLAPWPNRVADGTFIHDGEVHRLRITESGRSNAIHGFVGTLPWDVDDVSDSQVTLSLDLEPQPGWPWPMRYTVRWRLDAEGGLRGDVTCRNLGATACPFGFGFHPYLCAAGADLDDCVLSAGVARNLPLEPVRNLPAGPDVPADSVVPGLPRGIAARGLWLDHCFATAGRPRARLVGPDGRGAELWADDSFGWFQIFTADPARREGFPRVGRAVAVEPMTCPPDALRSGRDLIILGPGEWAELSMGIRATGPADVPPATTS